HYENALIMFNKAYTEANDINLKRMAKTAEEITSLLLKAERIGPEKSQKIINQAQKIKQRQNSERISYLYNDAYRYFYAKDYTKSTQAFQDILLLDPHQKESKNYLETKIPQAIRNEKIAALNKEAIDLFNKQEYSGSANLFSEILELNPDHKEAKDYAQIKIPDLIKEQRIRDLYREAILGFSVENYDEAAKAFNEIIALDPGQIQAQEYIESKIPQILNKQKVQALYNEAIASFNNREYENANGIFNQILALDPQQINAREYLETKIPLALKEQKINNLYKEALDYFSQGDYIGAKELFQEIISLDPQQVKATYYLQQMLPPILNKSGAESLYTKAVIYFNSGEYVKALNLFNELLILQPEHPKARMYVENKIPYELSRQKEQERRIFIETEIERYLSKEETAPPKTTTGLPPKPTNKTGVIGYLYDLAFQYYQAGELEKSADFFNKILLVNPGEFIAQSYLNRIVR
ncbi:MAG: tetratricopeptide repeat protein, partial [Candidatus Omnitrophica bacterium]|nr:tetratricopeptide repeat protein [Candidatus Omnitrophota bacterium]